MKSGTPEYAKPVDVVRALLCQLVALGDVDSWASFELGANAWVQVKMGEKQDFMVNFSYPFREPVADRLRAKGVDVPSGWTLEDPMPGKAMMYRTQPSEVDVVIWFVCDLIDRLYEPDAGYVLTGLLDR